jgi:uncharacterized protein (TIGR02001 family)
VVHSHPSRLTPARWLLTCALLLGAAAPAAVAAAFDTAEISVGGNVAVTSDYIYRGVSESDGRAALQAEVHGDTPGGTFGGVWASTRERRLEPGAGYDMEAYLGHRFELATAWSATLSARSHYFLGGGAEGSDDYQELSAALTWLDRWNVSVTAIPNAVRYWYYTRQSRSPAWITDTAGQWLLGAGLFVTAGAGYYRSTGTGPGRFAATGYAYGNAGLAYERHGWRVDVGYFLAESQAQELFPYPVANRKVAGTLSWHF